MTNFKNLKLNKIFKKSITKTRIICKNLINMDYKNRCTNINSLKKNQVY